ncbi:pyridoxal 5'-phosphate synthase glutaminase subunit PdxT [Salinibacterium sp. dk2585]|uniref:pyridoxal 5'-phosphate synthase glutaminase subunit PdxT n=1 Tax=unclassified Salinibacterium TaxID=2632331 RepID=UPI0011C25544|nr:MULTISPECIES: pyridoxal 5'-phosphate synthase glutaminase subunit PdxT [unclassified Salinibacterium]QEE61299.1 pyridoxal 5'-phosphate synthase glutaminase subunit PdxT [Salinibacterium sp. dk2585]TXK53975.1 pyridoxal 5'-phosphate synthase glutaminase subunit PdxT [Salinibacterium sp. dk5596]
MAGSTPIQITVGVLALQGAVREHLDALRRLGTEAQPVRTPADLAAVNALVIPGGESTVIDKLSRAFGLDGPIRAAISGGLPVLGTCAGLIMLADRIQGQAAGQRTFGGLDATVRRNAFGSQAESFETDVAVPELGGPAMHGVFIRAPIVEEVGPGVTVLGRLDDGRIVAVQQGKLLGVAFHPEISGEDRFHARLIDLAREAAGRN